MNSVVDHIAVLVNDLKLSEKWYLEALGGEVTHRQDNYIRLKLENVNIALLDKKIDTSKPHIGIICNKLEDLPECGAKISHRDGTTGVYLQDLDGNTIEFIHYGEKCQKFTK